MPRIRTVKPEFFEDEKLGRMPLLVRHLYIGLWIQCCDDYGSFRWSARSITGAVFPHDEEVSESDIKGALLLLLSSGRIDVYEVGGERYGQVLRWSKHQRVDHPAKKRNPAYSKELSLSSGNPRENLATPSPESSDVTYDHRPSTSDHRPPTREHTPAPSSPRAEPASESPAAAETNKAKRALAQWNEMSGQRLRSKTYLSSLKARAKEFSWEEVEAVLQWANTSRHERAQFLMARGNELDTLLRATKFEKYLGFARGDKRPVLKTVPQKPARLIEVRRRLTRSRSRLLVPDGVTVEQMKAQVRDGVEYDLIEDDQEEARG